jgi:hypothetical protein
MGRVLRRRRGVASGAHARAGCAPRGGSSPAASPPARRAAPPPGPGWARGPRARSLPPSLSLSLSLSVSLLPPAFRGAARPRLQAPRPRGEQWARAEAALRLPRSGSRSGAHGALPVRLAGVRPAGRRAVRLSRRPGFDGGPLLPVSSPRLLRRSAAGRSRGCRRTSGPPGLHQRPPPPERPPAALGLPRPGIFMKPPQLAGCHRSGSRSRPGLPGLLKGAAARGPGARRGGGGGPGGGRGVGLRRILGTWVGGVLALAPSNLSPCPRADSAPHPPHQV